VTRPAAFAYAQARLQARHAQLLDAGAWGMLEGARDFSPFLESARATSLRRWLTPFNALSTAHEIEGALRLQFRDYVAEISKWVPAPWRAAVLWVLALLDLPAMQHVLEGRAALAWMRGDASVGRFLDETGSPDLRALRASAWGPLARAWELGQPLREAWVGEWRLRWPADSGPAEAGLERLDAIVRLHLSAFAQHGTPEAAWNARGLLAAQLAHHFRRQLLRPAAVFTHLLLVALELERLRAELATRLLFGSPSGTAA
jgi:hypothetical protein